MPFPTLFRRTTAFTSHCPSTSFSRPFSVAAHASDINYKRHPELAQSSDTHIHLLRALLRQASYLPDPFARTYFRRHILARYRAYPYGKTWQRRRHPGYSEVALVSADRRAHLAHEARAAVRRLRRANEGYHEALIHVLLLAYGRTGKRRHELLRPLLAEDYVDTQHDPIHTHMRRLHPEHKAKVPVLSAMVVALLKSQAQRASSLPTAVPTLRLRVRSLVPDIAEENIWKRPMPQKRQTNKARAKHGELLDRALPPLPAEEFERLRRLAKGIEVPENWHVPRRHRGTEAHSDAFDISNINVVTSAGHPGPIKRPWAPDTRAGGKEHPHDITIRYMRRMWQIMFKASCRMDWDAEKSRWAFQWGSLPRGRACPPELRQALHGLTAERSSL